MKIAILFATETGNAETLAEDLASELAGAHDAAVSSLADFDPTDPRPDLLLVISSTYGEGELPAMAQTFCAAIGEGGDRLAGQPFAVFGLGDRQYGATFGAASGLIEQRLLAHGAVRVCEREVHDASGDAFMDDQAKDWCRRAVAAAEAR